MRVVYGLFILQMLVTWSILTPEESIYEPVYDIDGKIIYSSADFSPKPNNTFLLVFYCATVSIQLFFVLAYHMPRIDINKALSRHRYFNGRIRPPGPFKIFLLKFLLRTRIIAPEGEGEHLREINGWVFASFVLQLYYLIAIIALLGGLPTTANIEACELEYDLTLKIFFALFFLSFCLHLFFIIVRRFHSFFLTPND